LRSEEVVPANVRDTRGKNAARRTRVDGRIPAVVYGNYKDAVAVAVSPRDILKIVHSKTGHNTIFDIDIQGVERTPVMVVDEQYDPVRTVLLHVDLKRIDLSKKVRVAVPVVTYGDAKGVKQQGGLLEVVTRQVEVECVPDQIPEQFAVDVTDLMMGQSIRASDLPLAEGVRLLSQPDAVIAHVVGVKGAEEPAAGEVAPAVAEPEVVKKGKKEEAAPEEKGKKK
jgi:large subunit ribosomal protein L25